MAKRSGIALHAFDQMVRQMATDREPFPKRLWLAFSDCVVNEDICDALEQNAKSALDAFCEHYINAKLVDLDGNFISTQTAGLDEFTSINAFNELMRIKDMLRESAKADGR